MAERLWTREWQILRRECFYRDRKAQAVCHICNQPIDYSLPMSSTDEAYEADHIYPRSKHPELTLVASNIAASHRKCNRKRRDKATINDLGNQSREWGPRVE